MLLRAVARVLRPTVDVKCLLVIRNLTSRTVRDELSERGPLPSEVAEKFPSHGLQLGMPLPMNYHAQNLQIKMKHLIQ